MDKKEHRLVIKQLGCKLIKKEHRLVMKQLGYKFSKKKYRLAMKQYFDIHLRIRIGFFRRFELEVANK